MKVNLYNCGSYSSYACINSVKELIGNSKSVMFNFDKFAESRNITVSKNIPLYNKEEKELFIKKYIDTGLADVVNCGQILDTKTLKYLAVIEDGCATVFANAVGRVRMRGLVDDRSEIVAQCSDYFCLLCEKQRSEDDRYYSREIFVFGEDGRNRSECICEDCQESHKIRQGRVSDSELLCKIIAIKNT